MHLLQYSTDVKAKDTNMLQSHTPKFYAWYDTIRRVVPLSICFMSQQHGLDCISRLVTLYSMPYTSCARSYKPLLGKAQRTEEFAFFFLTI
jgi:hypothetical protein